MIYAVLYLVSVAIGNLDTKINESFKDCCGCGIGVCLDGVEIPIGYPYGVSPPGRELT